MPPIFAMGALVCPHAPRSLARAAARVAGLSLTSAAPRADGLGTPRWASSCALQIRPARLLVPRPPLFAGPRCAAGGPGQRHGESRRCFFSPSIVKNYEDLPRDYRDQKGLDFRPRPLSQAEADEIFGPGLGVDSATQLLRILHGRRVAGTLDDPAFYVHTARYGAHQIQRGLAFLRKTVPVDEVMNAGLRAQDELDQLDHRQEAKSRRQKKPSEVEQPAEQHDEDGEMEDRDAKQRAIYGRSALDEIRARNVAKRKLRERQRREAEEAAARAAPEQPAGPLAVVGGRQRRLQNAAVAKYYEEATSNIQEAPEMTSWERIMPSATVVVLAIGLLAALSMVYEEPSGHYRLLPQVSTSHATVGTLIGLNALMFLAWRVPPLWTRMNNYALLIIGMPKPMTLFTGIFSHQAARHLVVNMIPLWFVGTALHDDMSRAEFVALFLGCGAFGFLGSLVTYTLRGLLGTTTSGASGAVLGLCSAYFWEHGKDGFTFFGLPESGVHGLTFWGLLVASQLALFGRTIQMRVDVVSHLAGMAGGVAGIELINRSRRSRDPEAARERHGKAAPDGERERGRRTIDCTRWLRKDGAQGDEAGGDGSMPPGRRYKGSS